MNENTTTTATVSPESALRFAAITAQQAPSIFNTQPWRWQVNLPRLRLYADRTRQLQVADPDGRLLTISCGAALHHARVVLATSGTEITVKMTPDADDPDLLAEIEPVGAHHISPHEINMFAAIGDRHTDRRAFTAESVAPLVLARLRVAAETNGAHLHVLRGADLGTLASAVAKAGDIELGDGAYRMELADWTHRPAWSGDGIPPATAVASHRRAVPVRDFSPFEPAQGSPGTGDDKGAVFAIIFTETDDTSAWLNAGQALSAVLLTATDAGLASAPITDVVETTVTRETLRQQLLAGIGHPQVCVRIGHSAPGSPAASPRRHRLESIQIGQSIEEDMS